MKEFIKNITGAKKVVDYLREEFDKSKILSAKNLIHHIKQIKEPIKKFEDVEFSVFSQWGDDGIIQYLIHMLDIKNETFIEFGVGNYLEANTRFLLVNNNWRGLIFDGSEKNISFVHNDSISWKFDITAKPLFVTKENINTEIKSAGFEGEIGLLHIDIDGNDYWIWKNIDVVNPEIVIMEYNSGFGDERSISIPYQSDFERYQAHNSGLYYGASLQSFCDLASEKGYSFIGCNSYGNNAFFVRNDKIKSLKQITCKEGYQINYGRQNKDANGKFTFNSDINILKKIKGLKVINTRTGNIEELNS